jgi:Cro/C1-type helix-turn-helix DNA-binding protein
MRISSPPLSRCPQIDAARATGISRNMLSKLYYDRAQRVDLVDVAKLCEYLNSMRFRYKPPHHCTYHVARLS